MPLDPREVEKLIADQRFQSLSVPDQHATLRGYLSEQDNEFNGLDAINQQDVTSNLIQRYQPGLLSKIGDVAEYVPVVGGAVQGYRAAARGESARPLTRAASLGFEAQSPLGRAAQEAGRDVAEVAAVGGLTGLARPFLGKLATSIAGQALESGGAKLGAEALMDAALRATTSQSAERVAGLVAKSALRQRFIERGLTELTAGEMFGAVNAIERGIAGGEPEPLDDFVKTPLGFAALGTAFLGAGEVARRFGLRSLQPLMDDLAKRDPERMANIQKDGARVVQAVQRASGGRLSNEGAAEVVYNAVREPLVATQDVKVLKDALRQSPEIVDSELGLHLLRTQRERLTEPEVRVSTSPGLRVTYDDEQGRTITELLNDPAQQRAFAKRVSEGRIIVDNAAGDEAAIVRSGVRAGTPLMERVAPGGGPGRLVSEESGAPVGTIGGQIQLPAVRPETVDFADTVRGAATELRRQPIIGVPPAEPAVRRYVGDLAASPEAISRLREERVSGISYAARDVRGKGRERVVPGTVDRVDTRPGPYEVIVKRGGTERDVIVEAGAKVTPAQLDRVRAEEVQRFRQTVAQRQAAGPAQLAAPGGYDIGTLLPDGDVILVPKRDVGVSAPPPGTVTRTAGGKQVRVLDTPDPIGRITVEDVVSGQKIRTYAEGGIIRDREHLLEGLPLRPEQRVQPVLTMGDVQAMKRKALFDDQIRPGQVVHQSTRDLERRGVRPSVEIIARSGDRVLVRSGETAIETSVEDVAKTVESGTGRFAFDMTATGTNQLEMNAEKFNARLRETRALGDPRATPKQTAADVQLADELFAYDRRSGQKAGPSNLGSPRGTDEGLARRTRERQNRPIEERTKGGNALVKGCK